MKRRILFFLIIFSIFSMNAQLIKIACVGDSVTFGYGIQEREHNSYPAQLQEILGDNYVVKNFGYSGATMLKNGHKPYWTKLAFQKSQNFAPNIVIIHLGLNDQGNNNWPQHKGEFVADYLEMIEIYRNLPSKPKVIICKMSPTFSGHHWFEEGMRESFKEIQAKIKEVSKKANVDLINLHEPLYRYPEWFPDNLHPTKEGATVIAKNVYGAISGDFGGLKLPLLYGENMVLQRNEPIDFQGTGNAGEEVTIEFNGEKKSVKANDNGSWEVQFPLMKAGGPYQLKFSTKLKSVIIKKVYVGEVWLASGQSNMDFKVNAMEGASTVIKDSLSTNIFLFSMDGKAFPSNHVFSESELHSCNAGKYFEASGWTNTSGKDFENFSAVAYAYAYNLQKELNIPIGIICNAIGGSTTQSWISRESMEMRHETVDLLNDTRLNPMVDSWVSGRKEKNLEGLRKFDIKARHPYDPTFLFDAGIQPIKNYNIKGVIWYQGESNAGRVSFHSTLFKMLVKDWRMHWNKPELPFYYVQLSSINRPTWGYFRDAQRKLLTLSNTGMAVSSDVGHPTDVHPKEKWVVGKRLSNIALAKNYDKEVPFSGPLLDFVNVKKNRLKVHFLFGEGLKTSDDKKVKDILIAGADKVFVRAETKIKGNVLVLWSKKVKNPRFVKYGYTPYTEGNLINKYGLPASTFSNLKE